MTDLAISVLLAEGARSLAPFTEDSALEAEILLSFVLGKGRTYFRAFPDASVSEAESSHFRDLVAHRSKGEPIAYLTGQREFWSLDFEVNPSVLIPRHETELLVESALALIATDSGPTILDLGTGSGIIAITMGLARKDAKIIAVDASTAALSVARRNAARLGSSNVEFVASDWFTHIDKSIRFELIVSNPPYIADQDPHLQKGDLRFEPRAALTSGPDGLEDIRTIANRAREFLLPSASLIMEHGYDQATAVHRILIEAGYEGVETRRDLQGHPRVTMARYERVT